MPNVKMYAKIRNCNNQNPNLVLKTKARNNLYYKKSRYKFQDHQTSGSGKVFTIYYELWLPSLSCDMNWRFTRFCSPFPRWLQIIFALVSQAVSEILENDCHIHVYSTGAGTENPWGQKILKRKSYVNLVIC